MKINKILYKWYSVVFYFFYIENIDMPIANELEIEVEVGANE